MYISILALLVLLLSAPPAGAVSAEQIYLSAASDHHLMTVRIRLSPYSVLDRNRSILLSGTVSASPTTLVLLFLVYVLFHPSILYQLTFVAFNTTPLYPVLLWGLDSGTYDSMTDVFNVSTYSEGTDTSHTHPSGVALFIGIR